MRLLRIATAVLLLATHSAGAFAQSAPAPNAATGAPAKPPEPSPAALSADMEATLRKAGFTELQIMPNSVFVRGKDKAGNPVAMVLNPGSMTEMVTLDPHAGPAAGGNGAPTLTGSSTFATVLPTEKLASALVGTTVSSRSGAALGTIKDIAIDHGGVHAYILRVAGLLGIGERYTAVTPTALDLAYDPQARRYRATMDATPEQMKAAPEFKFEDVSEAAK